MSKTTLTLYCERLMYLEFVQGEWADNAFTVDGQAVHRRVNEAVKPLRPAPTPVAEADVDAEVEVEKRRSSLTRRARIYALLSDRQQ